MKKLISMVIVISLMCSATMAFANGIETEEETVNCEIIEEQHNIDVNQGITGFGNIDVECCENISEEDEKDFLQTWDEGTGENDSDIMLTSFSGTGQVKEVICQAWLSITIFIHSVGVNVGQSQIKLRCIIQLVKHGQQRKRCRLADINIWL